MNVSFAEIFAGREGDLGLVVGAIAALNFPSLVKVSSNQ
jgi:hypothetical protein